MFTYTQENLEIMSKTFYNERFGFSLYSPWILYSGRSNKPCRKQYHLLGFLVVDMDDIPGTLETSVGRASSLCRWRSPPSAFPSVRFPSDLITDKILLPVSTGMKDVRLCCKLI